MAKRRMLLLALAGLLLVIVIYVGVTYNSLVKKEEKVEQMWSDVQSTYQRRLDLIPNLVSAVKGLSEFESGTLEQVVAARDRAAGGSNSSVPADGSSYDAQTRLQDSMAVAVNRLIAVVENYPTLKGTDAYAGLQTQLEGTERRIKVARQDFNEAVADYNIAVRSSTSGLVARLFGFKSREGFKADAGADRAVEIKF